MSEASAEPNDLSARAQDALRRGDAAGALALLAKAEAAAPGDKSLKMQKAMVLRATGDLPGALDALDDALAIDPYDYLALLSKGALIERMSGERAAVAVYRNALKLAPAEADLPPQLKAPTERARAVIARAEDALEGYLREKTAEAASDCSGAARRRFDEAVAIYAGKTRIYNQEPLLLHYPRLPAIPFYDRGLFPWLPELEAATDTIVGELKVALKQAQDDFAPYIQYPKDVPVNQWGELNHSRLWSSLFLWKDGRRQDEACAICPKTASLLERLPLANQPGFAPTAMFSALAPRTRIPAHTGSTNVRLLTHLPLILPGPAFFRVGNETRPWKMGEAWVFDDTIEHEAWNDADELRVILIFDLWNPYIEEAERPLINALLKARNDFFAS